MFWPGLSFKVAPPASVVAGIVTVLPLVAADAPVLCHESVVPLPDVPYASSSHEMSPPMSVDERLMAGVCVPNVIADVLWL